MHAGFDAQYYKIVFYIIYTLRKEDSISRESSLNQIKLFLMSKTSLVQAFPQTEVKLKGGKEQCGTSGGDPISKLIELFFMQITTTFLFRVGTELPRL